MKIVVKSKNIKIDQEIKEFIEEKIGAIAKFSQIFRDKDYYGDFYGRGKPKSEVWVEIGKDTMHHKKGSFFFAECQVKFPRKSLRATAKKTNLKTAILEVRDEIVKQIKKYKQKKKENFERGIRILKEKIKISETARVRKK